MAQLRGVDASKAWSQINPQDSTPILFTISGGISLGSYQSGVNWALVRFIRRANERSYRERMHLARPYFAAMAGASAGNINALLSAVAWCNERPGESPDSSVFWKSWVPTGWQELFPRHDDRKELGGVFDRTYYDSVSMPGIKSGMHGVAYPEQCNIPLGMTMTRIVPTQTRVTQHVSASTQRYAALLRVKASGSDTTKDSVTFMQPEPRLFHASLGSLASLGVREGDIIPDSLVTKTLMASSAFPIAFAGVKLRYLPGENVPAAAACAAAGDPRTCPKRDTASFIDGGLFDNNPLALANGLFRLDPLNRTLQPRILYINPDALRGKLDSARAAHGAVTEQEKTGIASFLEVLKGAYPSARQYELQSMARYIADPAVEASSLPYITTTDRGYPIVSEHLYAFAGFFGRPFREYDFYAGVYDALHFVAETILCDDARQLSIVRAAHPDDYAPARDSVSRSACERNELQRLMHDSAFGFERVARIALTEFYAAEYTGPPVPIVTSDLTTLTREDSARVLFIRQLVFANAFEFPAHDGCTGDQIDRILCTDGFSGLVNRFSTDEVSIAVDTLAKDCEKTNKGRKRFEREPCLADATLVKLVDDGPRAFASARLNDIFQQINQDSTQSGGTKTLIGTMEFIHRSIDDEYQPPLLFDPSSIPPYGFIGWKLVPYRVLGLLGAQGVGGVEATYLPSLRVPHFISKLPGLKRLHEVRFILPLGIGRLRATPVTGDSAMHPVVETGLGLSYHKGVPWMHDISIDGRFMTHLRAVQPELHDELSFRGMWQLFGGKLSLGYGRLPSGFVRNQDSRNLFTIGVGDVNGLVYYVTRLFKN